MTCTFRLSNSGYCENPDAPHLWSAEAGECQHLRVTSERPQPTPPRVRRRCKVHWLPPKISEGVDGFLGTSCRPTIGGQVAVSKALL